MLGIPSDNGDRYQAEQEYTGVTDSLVYSVLKNFMSSEIDRNFEDVKIELIQDKKLLQLDCPSVTIAAGLLKISNRICLAVYGLKETLQLRFIPNIEILCAGKQFIPIINPDSLVRDTLMTNCSDNWQDNNSMISDLEIDLNELYRNKNAIYITQMQDQKVLFANKVALAANNRSAGDMVGKEVTALWDDDVLDRLIQSLQRDKKLWQYNYPGYRWSKEPNSAIWRRDRYMFVANYKLVEFLGAVCRFCIITSAEKIESALV